MNGEKGVRVRYFVFKIDDSLAKYDYRIGSRWNWWNLLRSLTMYKFCRQSWIITLVFITSLLIRVTMKINVSLHEKNVSIYRSK